MRLILTLAVVLAFSSCKKNGKESYMVLLPKDTLISVIVDMHMQDAILKEHILFTKPAYVGNEFYNKIYAKHNITDKQFVWNMIHYSETMEIDDLYDEAITKVSTMKGELEQSMVRNNAAK